MSKTKLFIFSFLVFCLMNVAFGGTGAIPSGPNIKLLKDNLRFKNTDTKIMTNDSDDPTAVAKNAEIGSIYIRSTTGVMYQKQDSGSSTNWQALLIGAPGLGTDECVARWDGTGVPNLNSSLFCITDAGAGTGLTSLVVDNIQVDGNTVSAINPGGNLVLDKDASGDYIVSDLTASRPLKLGASNELVASQIDLASTNDITGILPAANGGTGIDSDASSGIPNVAAGVWSISSLSSGISGAITDETGTGVLVFNDTPTLLTPTIASFTNATHSHQNAAGGGQLDHGLALTGLGDDDHPQYALLAGRAGGQTLIGGTAAGDDLTFQTTSDGTKGSYVFPELTASQWVKTDGSSGLTTVASIDASTDITGILPNDHGGTGVDSSGFTGVAKVAAGVWSASTIVNADVNASADIDATKLGTGVVDNTEFNLLNGRTYIPDAVGTNNQVATFDGTNSIDSTANFTNDNGDVGINGDLTVDNMNLNGNIITTTSGDLNLESVAGSNVTIDPGGAGYLLLDSLGGGQSYRIDTENTTNLAFQGQGPATQAFYNYFTNDGDGGDSIGMTLYNLGLPDSVANSEGLQIFNNTGASDWIIRSQAAGTGTVRQLLLETGANAGQITLETDGDISITNNFSMGGNLISNTSGNLEIDSDASLDLDGNVNILTGQELRFNDSAGGEYLGFKAPTAFSGSVTLELPDGDATIVNQALLSNAAGVLSWGFPTAVPTFSVSTQGGNYTILDGDGITTLLMSGASTTATLPTAADNTDRRIVIKNISGGVVTIDGEASEDIDASNDYILNSDDQSVTLTSDGTQWHVLNDYRTFYGVKYDTDAAQSISSATLTIVDFDSTTHGFDKAPGAVTTGGTWEFRVPTGHAGIYYISAKVDFNDDVGTWNAGELAEMDVYKNGVRTAHLDIWDTNVTASVNHRVSLQGDTFLELAENDYIDIRVYQNQGGAIALLGSEENNYVIIQKVQ